MNINKNMCLAVNGGTLEGDAQEKHRDGDFDTQVYYLDYNPGSGSKQSDITFPSCHISYALMRVGENGSGNHSSSYNLYLRIGGVWTSIKSATGTSSNDWNYQSPTDINNDGNGWDDVTGIRLYIATSSSIGVARVYDYEVQAWGYKREPVILMY